MVATVLISQPGRDVTLKESDDLIFSDSFTVQDASQKKTIVLGDLSKLASEKVYTLSQLIAVISKSDQPLTSIQKTNFFSLLKKHKKNLYPEILERALEVTKVSQDETQLLEFFQRYPEIAERLLPEQLTAYGTKFAKVGRHIVKTAALSNLLGNAARYQIYKAHQDVFYLAHSVLAFRNYRTIYSDNLSQQINVSPELQQLDGLYKELYVYYAEKDALEVRKENLRAYFVNLKEFEEIEKKIVKGENLTDKQNADNGFLEREKKTLNEFLVKLEKDLDISSRLTLDQAKQEIQVAVQRLSEIENNIAECLPKLQAIAAPSHDKLLGKRSLDIFLRKHSTAQDIERSHLNLLDILDTESRYTSLVDDEHVEAMFSLIKDHEEFLRVFNYLLLRNHTAVYLNKLLKDASLNPADNDNPKASIKDLALHNLRKYIYTDHVLLREKNPKGHKFLSRAPKFAKSLYLNHPQLLPNGLTNSQGKIEFRDEVKAFVEANRDWMTWQHFAALTSKVANNHQKDWLEFLKNESVLPKLRAGIYDAVSSVQNIADNKPFVLAILRNTKVSKLIDEETYFMQFFGENKNYLKSALHNILENSKSNGKYDDEICKAIALNKPLFHYLRKSPNPHSVSPLLNAAKIVQEKLDGFRKNRWVKSWAKNDLVAVLVKANLDIKTVFGLAQDSPDVKWYLANNKNLYKRLEKAWINKGAGFFGASEEHKEKQIASLRAALGIGGAAVSVARPSASSQVEPRAPEIDYSKYSMLQLLDSHDLAPQKIKAELLKKDAVDLAKTDIKYSRIVSDLFEQNEELGNKLLAAIAPENFASIAFYVNKVVNAKAQLTLEQVLNLLVSNNFADTKQKQAFEKALLAHSPKNDQFFVALLNHPQLLTSVIKSNPEFFRRLVNSEKLNALAAQQQGNENLQFWRNYPVVLNLLSVKAVPVSQNNGPQANITSIALKKREKTNDELIIDEKREDAKKIAIQIEKLTGGKDEAFISSEAIKQQIVKLKAQHEAIESQIEKMKAEILSSSPALSGVKSVKARATAETDEQKNRKYLLNLLSDPQFIIPQSIPALLQLKDKLITEKLNSMVVKHQELLLDVLKEISKTQGVRQLIISLQESIAQLFASDDPRVVGYVRSHAQLALMFLKLDSADKAKSLFVDFCKRNPSVVSSIVKQNPSELFETYKNGPASTNSIFNENIGLFVEFLKTQKTLVFQEFTADVFYDWVRKHKGLLEVVLTDPDYLSYFLIAEKADINAFAQYKLNIFKALEIKEVKQVEVVQEKAEKPEPKKMVLDKNAAPGAALGNKQEEGTDSAVSSRKSPTVEAVFAIVLNAKALLKLIEDKDAAELIMSTDVCVKKLLEDDGFTADHVVKYKDKITAYLVKPTNKEAIQNFDVKVYEKLLATHKDKLLSNANIAIRILNAKSNNFGFIKTYRTDFSKLMRNNVFVQALTPATFQAVVGSFEQDVLPEQFDGVHKFKRELLPSQNRDLVHHWVLYQPEYEEKAKAGTLNEELKGILIIQAAQNWLAKFSGLNVANIEIVLAFLNKASAEDVKKNYQFYLPLLMNATNQLGRDIEKFIFANVPEIDAQLVDATVYERVKPVVQANIDKPVIAPSRMDLFRPLLADPYSLLAFFDRGDVNARLIAEHADVFMPLFDSEQLTPARVIKLYSSGHPEIVQKIFENSDLFVHLGNFKPTEDQLEMMLRLVSAGKGAHFVSKFKKDLRGKITRLLANFDTNQDVLIKLFKNASELFANLESEGLAKFVKVSDLELASIIVSRSDELVAFETLLQKHDTMKELIVNNAFVLAVLMNEKARNNADVKTHLPSLVELYRRNDLALTQQLFELRNDEGFKLSSLSPDELKEVYLLNPALMRDSILMDDGLRQNLFSKLTDDEKANFLREVIVTDDEKLTQKVVFLPEVDHVNVAEHPYLLANATFAKWVFANKERIQKMELEPVHLEYAQAVNNLNADINPDVSFTPRRKTSRSPSPTRNKDELPKKTGLFSKFRSSSSAKIAKATELSEEDYLDKLIDKREVSNYKSLAEKLFTLRNNDIINFVDFFISNQAFDALSNALKSLNQDYSAIKAFQRTMQTFIEIPILTSLLESKDIVQWGNKSSTNALICLVNKHVTDVLTKENILMLGKPAQLGTTDESVKSQLLKMNTIPEAIKLQLTQMQSAHAQDDHLSLTAATQGHAGNMFGAPPPPPPPPGASMAPAAPPPPPPLSKNS